MDPNGPPHVSSSMPPAHFPPMGAKMGPPPMGMPPGMHPMMNQDYTGNYMKPNNMPMGMPSMMPGFPNQNSGKSIEFARGIYVSGFERTLTVEMLQDHFKIKPIHALKLPMSKFYENKGFAFIYYGSEEDAAEVKKKLDYSVILHNKIRVTRTVIAENLSKMMFKLKTDNMSETEVDEVQKRYFNEQNLEKEVERIIEPHFKDNIEINKIVIPLSKKDKKSSLNYSRVFFYVKNLKEAGRIVKSMREPVPNGAEKLEN